MGRKRQPTYHELFTKGDPVDVAEAPRDGESEPQWIRGKVIRITTRLHVELPGVTHHMAYDRADYNRGRIRKVQRFTPADDRKAFRGLTRAERAIAAAKESDAKVTRAKGTVTIPEPFSDSFTTEEAGFYVEVKRRRGQATEDIEVKIDCGGVVHGDEDLIDLLVEMLEKAKENLATRRIRRLRAAEKRPTVAPRQRAGNKRSR